MPTQPSVLPPGGCTHSSCLACTSHEERETEGCGVQFMPRATLSSQYPPNRTSNARRGSYETTLSLGTLASSDFRAEGHSNWLIDADALVCPPASLAPPSEGLGTPACAEPVPVWYSPLQPAYYSSSSSSSSSSLWTHTGHLRACCCTLALIPFRGVVRCVAVRRAC